MKGILFGNLLAAQIRRMTRGACSEISWERVQPFREVGESAGIYVKKRTVLRNIAENV
ncbi:MAG: hypothetical protein KHY89_09895 [Butyricicoccus pullicaecorum]|nr:hypothetical protein [Butyricicoccus pullicaecorum]